jgi:uncharacterized membrane protein YhaH (DUF805 family)
MSDTAESTWFYTRQGEQLGPLTFDGLREKARAGEINPRLDMAWTQGMAEWKPAGEIDGLFEKPAAPELAETLAPAADPYTPPQQNEAAAMHEPEDGWPGIQRLGFYLMTFLFPFLWHFGFTFAVPYLTTLFGPEVMGAAIIVAMLIPVFVAITYGLKRLVNLGMSRWWYLGTFVPILNIWVCYRMYVCPAGYAYHKKLDGAGVALAIFFWLMILLIVLMVASLIALMFGVIGSPEIQQQIQEAIRDMRQGNK